MIDSWKWDVSQITVSQTRSIMKYAVLILNRPVTLREEFIKEFWNNATVRITVDGGTLHWDIFLNKMSNDVQKKMKLQELITGDFDSVPEETLEKYKKKGCKIVHTLDQNYTDFTKSLMELNTYCKQHRIEMDHVIAIVQNSGRIDQILGNVQTLFLAKEKHLIHPNTKLYLISDDSISWLLFPGDHVIHIPEETRMHKRAWCSLVPIGSTCESVTSSGLKWNLDKQPLKFGDLISTSNTFDGSEKVKIKCSHPILWSMRVPSLACKLTIKSS